MDFPSGGILSSPSQGSDPQLQIRPKAEDLPWQGGTPAFKKGYSDVLHSQERNLNAGVGMRIYQLMELT